MDTIRKHSKKRDAILNCLRETDAHPSAEWVYSRLKPQIPDLSLGTVYRNLALFKETGEAISLGTVMGLERFDGRTDPHIHFVCTRCGRILDLPGIQVPPCLTEQAESEPVCKSEPAPHCPWQPGFDRHRSPQRHPPQPERLEVKRGL